MKIRYFALFILLYLNTIMRGQQEIEIEGRITDIASSPLAYANVYNKTLRKGTISNDEGYFRIPVSSLEDTVCITFTGFKDYILQPAQNKFFYTIYLEENTYTLGEVKVTPKENSYLYSLLGLCRKNVPVDSQTSKACFELKTYRDDVQVELVEGYYNLKIKGYEIKDLEIKAGRIALRPLSNRFFASLESSHAILMLKLTAKNEYFPLNPMEMSPNKLKKYFYLDLDKKYIGNDSDSIYVIDYVPKIRNGKFFEGKIWVNTSKNFIVKMTFNAENSSLHPFLPLFYLHNISGVSFNITKTFQFVNNQCVFNHIDFQYSVAYNGAGKSPAEEKYAVKTKAVLYAYDYNTLFFSPLFQISDKAYTDYRKISAMPYNTFFWKHNDEYRLNDSLDTNEVYFSDSASYTSSSLFKGNKFMKKGFFEHPFITWSADRIQFLENFSDTITDPLSSGFIADKYNLAVKFYVDINTYNDSVNILSAAVIDPYDSFYKLPVDNYTHGFINLYFDLCEIERRKMEKEIEPVKSDFKQVKEIYGNFLRIMEAQKKEYVKAVERGTNREKMLEYNAYVLKHLGIDNIKLFGLFPQEEE